MKATRPPEITTPIVEHTLNASADRWRSFHAQLVLQNVSMSCIEVSIRRREDRRPSPIETKTSFPASWRRTRTSPRSRYAPTLPFLHTSTHGAGGSLRLNSHTDGDLPHPPPCLLLGPRCTDGHECGPAPSARGNRALDCLRASRALSADDNPRRAGLP